MAILPVSSINVNSRNSVNFGNKYENNYEEAPAKCRLGGAGKYSTVPVIVLMAMNPSLLNSNAANLPEKAIEPNVIEAQVPEYDADVDEAAYVMSPELDDVEQSYPFGWRGLHYEKIQYSRAAQGNGMPHHMVYANTNMHAKDNVVNAVYLIKDGTGDSKNISHNPPLVNKLIYHDIGEKDEYCGVYVAEEIYDSKGYAHTLNREIRLDHDTAQELINLITDHSKWENKTRIAFIRTKNPDLTPRKVTGKVR